jgi:hypothetical protein
MESFENKKWNLIILNEASDIFYFGQLVGRQKAETLNYQSCSNYIPVSSANWQSSG